MNKSFHGLNGESQKPKNIRNPDQAFFIALFYHFQQKAAPLQDGLLLFISHALSGFCAPVNLIESKEQTLDVFKQTAQLGDSECFTDSQTLELVSNPETADGVALPAETRDCDAVVIV